MIEDEGTRKTFSCVAFASLILTFFSTMFCVNNEAIAWAIIYAGTMQALCRK